VSRDELLYGKKFTKAEKFWIFLDFADNTKLAKFEFS